MISINPYWLHVMSFLIVIIHLHLFIKCIAIKMKQFDSKHL